MTTAANWKAMLASRGIRVWISEKVARAARGIVIDSVIDKVAEYREASLRLFAEGNSDASYWAARAMEDRAIELDCAVAERKETQAGRKQVAEAKKSAKKKSKDAQAKYGKWQLAAEKIWRNPQHKNKSAVAVATLIDDKQANTIRKHIKRPKK